MRIALSFVTLLCGVGCDEVYGLTGRGDDAATSGSDGGPIDACSTGTFSTSVVYQLSTAVEYDPQLSPDGLELYTTGGGILDILRATRASTDAMFGPSTPLLAGVVNSPAEDADPALTGDGLLLAFVSTRMPQPVLHSVWESRRAGLGSEWGAATPVQGIDVDARSIDLSPDGLTLYAVDTTASATLWRYHRDAIGGVFAGKTRVGMKTEWPSVSPDGSEVYYNDGTTVVRMTKSTSDTFETPESVVANAGDPDVSPDGSSLTFVVSAGGGIAQIKRSCQ